MVKMLKGLIWMSIIFSLAGFCVSFDHSQHQRSRTFTNETICKFPSFLKTALGIACVEQTDDRLWFAPAAVPVRTVAKPNETCPSGRYQWPSPNATLCCLELSCPSGQVLAKDERNTPTGECPRCKNIVFEYVCDPKNDTCGQLHLGSSCRNFFNSTSIFICACDAKHGYTQNRLAFPVSCTRTIGAVCFMQEHCKFVDVNTFCDLDQELRPPRGTCQCQNGTTLDAADGRCVNDGSSANETAEIRKVRQSVADWGDQNNWSDGPIKDFPYYDFSAWRSSKPKSYVMDQLVASDVPLKTSTKRFPRDTNASNPEVQKVGTKPQAYMISAQHMNGNLNNTALIGQSSQLDGDSRDALVHQLIHDDPKMVTEAADKLQSASAISGTKFATDDRETLVDNVLNIIRPVKRKLQTDRPTTSATWDVTEKTTATVVTWPAMSFVPLSTHTLKTSEKTLRTTVGTVALRTETPSTAAPSATVPQPTSTTPEISTMRTAKRFTRTSTRTTPSTTILPRTSTAISDMPSSTSTTSTQSTPVVTTSIAAVSSPSSTTTSTATTTTTTTSSTSTLPSTTATMPTVSSTSTAKLTTAAVTPSLKPSTPAEPVTGSWINSKGVTKTPETITLRTTSMTTASSKLISTTTRPPKAAESFTFSSIFPTDQESLNSFDESGGILKIQLNDNRRFGGVVRIPSGGSVIGGVGRPASPVFSASNANSFEDSTLTDWLLNAAKSTSTVPTTSKTTITAAAPSTTTISRTQTSPMTTTSITTTSTTSTTAKPTTTTSMPTTSPTTKIIRQSNFDLSFLQDSSVSKSDMQRRLLQLLLDLSVTTTSTTTTTTPATTPMDFSFLSDPSLSSADKQLRLLPLLIQLNAQLPATTTIPELITTLSPTTSTISGYERPWTKRTSRRRSSGTFTPDLALALSHLQDIQAEDAKGVSNGQILLRVTTAAPSPTTTEDDSPDVEYATEAPQRKRTISFFNAIMSGFGAVMPHKKSKVHPESTTYPDTTPEPTSPTTTTMRTKHTDRTTDRPNPRTKSSFSQFDEILDASGLPVPSFSKVFSSLGSMVGGFLGGGKKPQRMGSRPDPNDPDDMGSVSNLKTDNGKLDMSDPRTQMQLAKLMQQQDKMGGASNGYGSSMPSKISNSNSYSSSKSQMPSASSSSSSNANSKFNFDSPRDQVEFIKFLQTFDKYPPAQTKGSGSGSGPNPLFPQPPPAKTDGDGSYVPPPPPTTTTTLRPLPTPAKMIPVMGPQPVNMLSRPNANAPPGMPIHADSLSPEAWNLINQMQTPGYYNVTKEQLAALQPILKQIKADQIASTVAENPKGYGNYLPPSPATPPPENPGRYEYQPQSPIQPAQPLPETYYGGAQYAPYNDAAPPVPPLLPVLSQLTDSLVPPTTVATAPPTTTASTTTTTTTTASSTTNAPVLTTKLVFDSQAKMLMPFPDSNIQFVAAPLVNNPSQPAFSAVLQQPGCPVDCAYQDPNSFCDTKSGACLCRYGYHASFLEGNVCTKTIFSICSSDEDCKSGGDFHSECAFNGVNRFCTCSNGFLPDSDGMCRAMFAERCSGSCNIPNAVCDQFTSYCRCPTGYAWFKDPWTGQPVCRAALGGSVPCRSDQDLCPIYTPRGRCRNNAFCGCDDGYIPDSWFTNQSERTACIDVLSAKCDDSSDCTVADRNTICDRRVRMCTCKPGYKPDPFHNSACITAS